MKWQWPINLIFTGKLLSFFHIELIKMFRMLGTVSMNGFMHKISGMIVVYASGVHNNHALNPMNEPLNLPIYVMQWPNEPVYGIYIPICSLHY